MSGHPLAEHLPMTAVIGFVEAPLASCAEALVELVARGWRVEPAAVRRDEVSGPLAHALAPLRPPRPGTDGDRFLVAPTASGWTAWFENGATGGDPRVIAGELPDRLGCPTVTVYAAPGDTGFDALGYTLQAPGRAGMLDAVRVLVVDGSSGGTEVQAYGDPLPGEPADPARLDVVTLDGVLAGLGLRPFDESFYLPPGTRGLVLVGPRPPGDGAAER